MAPCSDRVQGASSSSVAPFRAADNHGRTSTEMSLQRLQRITILAPLLFFVGLDLVRHNLFPDELQSWPGTVLMAGFVLLGSLLFSEAVFSLIERMQDRLGQQNLELLALHQAGLDIAGDLSLDTVLQKVVDQARELVAAHYGALSLLGERGSVEEFLTSGITAEERAAIGPIPQGHGLLSVVLHQGERLRLPDLEKDPRSIGFPEFHPRMHSLLAVPIISRGAVLGNLYVTEKIGAEEFSQEDEETLERFATQAAVAIENARLHQQVRGLAITEERERIAREMHDSLAQVLGYVNTKAQAIQELLRANHVDRAEAQIGQLSEAARAAYADVREGILGLRTSLGPKRGLLDALGEYLHLWEEQSDIATELDLSPAGTTLSSLDEAAELQLLRIIQEALANVRKHAGATRVRVGLAEADGQVEAIVDDNGQGFDPARLGSARVPRFGLSTMRERAEAVGGTLQIVSTPGRGTKVIIRLPAHRVLLPNGESRARSYR